jgi:tripeptide aminopeptidase
MPSASRTAVPEIADKRAVDLVMDMLAIPGKSGEEGRVAAYIRQRLKQAGVPDDCVTHDGATRHSPAGGEVGNLIVRLPGTLKSPRRLLMGHIDTVPLCVGARPVRRGKLIESKDAHTALGGDNRAGASVVLNAILEIRRQRLPHPPLTLFWPVQEEIGLYGARFVSVPKLGKPKLCFNWDGGDPQLVTIGATGDYALSIEVEGLASHAGAHPEQGVSAAAVAALAIADLVANGWHGLIIKGPHTGTSNVGTVHGGDATNVVMPHLAIKAEARSHDPEFRLRIVEAYRSAFEQAATKIESISGCTAQVRVSAELKYESFRLSLEEPCVQAAIAAIQAVGLVPEPRIANGGLDANWMTARDLPTVTLGCGQHEIHTVNETLDVEQYLTACRIGLALATGTGNGELSRAR